MLHCCKLGLHLVHQQLVVRETEGIHLPRDYKGKDQKEPVLDSVSS